MFKEVLSTICRVCLYLSGACFVGSIGCWIAGYMAGCRFLPVSGTILLAIGLSSVSTLKRYRFTVCILAAVTTAMLYPNYFSEIGGIAQHVTDGDDTVFLLGEF